jgi:N-acetylneuraminate synthase/sialic acid synthase
MNKMFSRKGLKPIIIAEVGQNHQGNIDIAKKYVEDFSKLGADIIKFQCRSNKDLFSTDALNKNYDSENSFGKTYGEHRAKLELSLGNLKTLKKLCKKYKVQFMVTPFDEKSLENVCKIGVDIIKIASFDLGNLPFIEKIAKKKKIVVMSTGGGKFEDIKSSIKILEKYNNKIILLHCVSKYPCPYNELMLNKITNLKKNFPKCIIGLSDHFNGVLSGPLAYMLGARVFEKHVTFDRSWKGSDHSFALEPNGFRKFCRDLKRTPEMISVKTDKNIGKEPVFEKLGKSIIVNKKLKKGSRIKISDLSGKIFSKNIVLVRYARNFIGKYLNKNIEVNHPLRYKDIK